MAGLLLNEDLMALIRQRFTLLEIVVILAVVALLSAFLLPVAVRYAHNKSLLGGRTTSPPMVAFVRLNR